MGNTLLRTKLNIPQIRPSLVPCQRLADKLDAGLETRSGTFTRKLTLVSAPAGFGKTTLLGEWIYADRRPVAWVSLDEGDNDPALSWTTCLITCTWQSLLEHVRGARGTF